MAKCQIDCRDILRSPHGLDVQMCTIGFLDIEDGKASASIWRITPEGIATYDWTTWKWPR